MKQWFTLTAILLWGSLAQGADYILSSSLRQLITHTTVLMDEGHYAAAARTLERATTQQSLPITERAVLAHQLGAVYATLKDYPRARAQFESALYTQALPAAMQSQLRYNLAQVYLVQKQAEAELEILQPVAKTKSNPELSFLIATCYAELEHNAEAWQWVLQALQHGQIIEKHYAWAARLAITLRHYSDARRLLETLVFHHPRKPIYSRQLIAVLVELGDGLQALTVGEMAYRRGVHNGETDILQLARLYLQQRLPYAAGRLLENEMADSRVLPTAANLKLLATAWLHARAYQSAVTALKRISEPKYGDTFLHLAHIFAQRGDWLQSKRLLVRALSDQHLDDWASAYLLQGIVLFRLGDKERAWRAFNKASEFDNTQARALVWIDYLKSS